MIGYRLLPPAEEEMTEAALFYETARTGFGDIFLDDVQRAIDSIREQPEIGANIAYGFRRVLFQRFPFSIIYWIESGEIVVGCGSSASASELLDQAHMTANNTLERAEVHLAARRGERHLLTSRSARSAAQRMR